MDYNRLDQLLAASLDDLAGESYSDDARQAAILLAIREYSRYVPVLRRLGCGITLNALAVGGTSIIATGGMFNVGEQIIVGLGTNAETCTISAVSPDASYGLDLGAPTQLTVGALTKNHRKGTYVAKATIGLQIVPGVDTYELPPDFIKPDQDSLDLAVGARATIKKTSAFYDSAYLNTNRLSGPTPNTSQNVQGGIRNYQNNPNGGGFAQNPSEVLYRFSLSGLPILTIYPVPTANRTLDFYYSASQTVDTVPDSDLDAIVALCTAKALSQRASAFGGQGSYKEGDEAVDGAKSAGELRMLAKEQQDKFDNYIRFRPFAQGG